MANGYDYGRVWPGKFLYCGGKLCLWNVSTQNELFSAGLALFVTMNHYLINFNYALFNDGLIHISCAHPKSGPSSRLPRQSALRLWL